MTVDIPPGLVWMAERLPGFFTPPALVVCGRLLLRQTLHVDVPMWLTVIICGCSLPLAMAVSILYRDYVIHSEARMHGAVLAPMVHDRSLAGLDTLKLLVFNFKQGYIGEPFLAWTKECGHTFMLNILFEKRVFTTEPEYIKAILATQFETFDKGPFSIRQMSTLLGSGVFNADGELWKFHRSMTRPFFSKDRIAHFDIFDRHASDVISQMKRRFREGYPVDFQDAVSRFTLDSATEFLFGSDVESLAAGLPYPQPSTAFPISPSHLNNKNHPANRFAHAFAEAQSLSALRSRFGVNWPLREFWRDHCKEHMDVVDGYIEPILKEAVRHRQETAATETKEVGEGDTLLSHLVNHTQDTEILKDEILNIMIAGRDTTAGTLAFCFYMLAEHPHVMERLREEVLSNLGNGRPTYESLRDMKYLRAVINETLRLYPSVPLNIRTSNKATIWPAKQPGAKPFYIPANTKTPYSVFLMHRREDLWGPDALEFDPDRFIDERVQKYLTPNPFIFLPFNAGPRICLGQQFAYNEMSFFIVRMLQNFKSVALAPDAQPASSKPPTRWASVPGKQSTEKIWPKAHLTMYALDGVWVNMEESLVAEAV